MADLRRQLEVAQAAAAEAAGNDAKLKRQAQTVAELAAAKSKLVTTESRLAKLQDRHAVLQVRSQLGAPGQPGRAGACGRGAAAPWAAQRAAGGRQRVDALARRLPQPSSSAAPHLPK